MYMNDIELLFCEFVADILYTFKIVPFFVAPVNKTNVYLNITIRCDRFYLLFYMYTEIDVIRNGIHIRNVEYFHAIKVFESLVENF